MFWDSYEQTNIEVSFIHNPKLLEGMLLTAYCRQATLRFLSKPKRKAWWLKPTLRIMQLTAALLLIFSLTLSARSNSQSITFKGNNVPLEKVFKVIKDQTGYVVVIDQTQLQDARNINVDAASIDLEKFLNIIFKDQPFNYLVDGKNIFIKKKAADVNPRLTFPVLETPPITVKGRIVNEKGEPVAASVVVKGAAKGVSTDNYGNFEIENVNDDKVIIISAVGYQPLEIEAKNVSQTIVLKLSDSKLDEVVFKGYYFTSKKLNTGAVSTVNAEEIQTQPVTNSLVAISGRMAGVNIQQGSGMPGGAVNIQIRGRNSIRNELFNNGNLPLYVIDGVPFPAQIISSTQANESNQKYGSPLSLINPADIERIDILKDADATAAYGSRGANGVVLITTKKGKSGKMTVAANLLSGFGKVSRKLKLLNTDQYMEMRTTAVLNNGQVALLNNPANALTFPDIKLYDSSSYIDWQKFYIGNTANFKSAQLSLSGGSSNVQYLFSSSLNKEGTVMPGNKSSKKGLFNLNLGFSSTDKKLKANISAVYSVDNTDLSLFDPMTLILTPPHAPPAYINDELNWDFRYRAANPASALEKKYLGKSNNLIANSIINYELINGLVLRVQAGYNKLQQEQNVIIPLKASDPATTRFGSTSVNSIGAETYNLQPEVEYLTGFLSGDLSVLFSSTWQQTINQQQGYRGSAYTSDLYIDNISLAPELTAAPPVYSKYAYNGFLGKITYNYQNKYIINLIGRRDGSSRFGQDKQFGNFGSVGVAWIFSNESFFKSIPIISFGKLRASYGTTGSDQIGDYGYYDTYTNPSYSYNNSTSLVPARIVNTDYSWELSKKMDYALELGFFKDRLLVSTGYYLNRTSKQLVGYPLPPNSGSPSGDVQANSPAVVQNTGVEIEITSKNISRKNFSWTTNFNLTLPKNKLLQYPGIEGSSYASRLIVGQPLAIQRVYEFTGVDPETGLYKVVDKNEDGIFDGKDYISVFAGQKAFGGILNSFSFKNFQVDFHFHFIKQSGANIYYYLAAPGTFGINYPVEIMDRWQKPGDVTRFQQFRTNGPARTAYGLYKNSNAVFGDASFIRLKNLSVAYNFSGLSKAIHAQSFKAYVQGQNLWTMTNYEGFDPEMANAQALPTIRMITFGVQCVF